MPHTPGTWRIVAEGKTPPRPLTHEVATVGFLQIWGTGVDLRQTVEADANLIAAAPDLLAACKDMREILLGITPMRAGAALATSVAAVAIAKAEGRNQ
jgi:hypothetical protein